MDAMEMIEMLESAWFFSSVFTTKTTGHSNAKIESKQETSSDSSEAIKPTNITPQNHPKPSKLRSPPKSPQEKRSVAVPVTEETASDVSRSPRRREEDERRRMRRWQRNYNNTEICRGLNLEGEIEFCGGRELKDLKAMKRQLKTWAMAVASSSVAQTRPITALCC